MKDYANQFNKRRTHTIEALSWIVTALIIIVGVWVIMSLDIYLCSDVVTGKCI